jgi:hypothetical protein
MLESTLREIQLFEEYDPIEERFPSQSPRVTVR